MNLNHGMKCLPFISKTVLPLVGLAAKCNLFPRPTGAASSISISNPFFRRTSTFSIANNSSAAVNSRGSRLW